MNQIKAVLALLFLSHSSLAAESIAGQNFVNLVPQIQETMVNCPEKIWPGYSWKNVNLFMLENGVPAKVWHGENGLVDSVNDSQFPSESYSGLYNTFVWNNQNSLSVFPNGHRVYSRPDYLFKLATHEGFHKFGQQGWKSRADSTRGTEYPVDYKPRLYRRMLFDRLQQYFITWGTEKSHLQKAAYWFDKWRTEYPSENQSTTDGYEGTARYVESVSWMYAQKGCAASDMRILGGLQSEVISYYGGFVTSDTFALEKEGYDIGGLSALTLRFIEKRTDWFAPMAQAVTPPEILMKDQTKTPDVSSEKLEQEFKKAGEEQNKFLSELMGTFISDYQDPKYIRVALSGNISSFASPYAFILPKVLPGDTVVPISEDLELKNSVSGVTVKAKTPLYLPATNPCPGTVFVLLMPLEKVLAGFSDGKVLKLNSNGVTGSMPGIIGRDAKSVVWFCGAL